MNAVSLLKKHFDLPALTTDVIVGFPGETDTEFNETVEFVKTVHFSKLHVFPYSIRTAPKQRSCQTRLTRRPKKTRVHILTELDELFQQEFAQQFIGKAESVLFEEQDPDIKEHLWATPSDMFASVHQQLQTR